VGRYFAVQTRPLEELHYKTDYFDIVRAHNVIEHLPSPKAMVREVHRILRPGGLFAVSTPNFDSISLKLLGKDWPYICGDNHVYLFDPKALTRLLGEEGFRIIRMKSKGVHLNRKDHTNGASHTLFSRMFGVAEKTLDLIIRRTLKGHRLNVWAEKI
jgi:2-polyprenyl-3-methyl-5-hydroxy-6-metoxy-1,4-benzoquinol methylase